MNATVFAAILAKLNADSTLTGYLGSNRFYRAKRATPATYPACPVTTNNEGCTLRPGYNAAKVRDHNPTIQIDIFADGAGESFPCTGEDVDQIQGRIEAVLLDATSPATGTRQGTWRKITESQQYEEDTEIWHNAVRFEFLYKITDT